MSPNQAKALTHFVWGAGDRLSRLFGAMVEALPIAIYTTDAEGHLKYFNSAAVKLSGRVPELGTDQWCVTWKLFRSDGTRLPHDECPMAIALKGGEVPSGIECIAERPDGTVFWFTPYPVILRDAKGQIAGGMNLLVDITNRKNAEIEAVEALRQLRFTTDNMDVGVTRCTSDLRYLWVSRAFAHWLGQMPEDIAGRPILDVIGQEAYESKRPYIEKVLSGQRVEFEAQITFLGTGRRWIHAVYVPTKGKDNTVDGWIAVVTDVTDRHEAADRLRASERQLRDAQRLAKVGSWERILNGESSYWSEEMARILGLPNEMPASFEAFVNCIHPNDRQRVLELERHVRSNRGAIELEYRIVRPDGEFRFVRSMVEAIRNDQGVPIRLTGATQDVTEQVKARELLGESEQRLKNAERLANVGHWDWDLNSNQVVWSEGTFRIFGQPRDYKPTYEDLLRMTVPKDRALVDQAVRGALAENRGFVIEFQIALPDGDLRTVKSVSEVTLDAERGVPVRIFGTVQDVTDERREQEESLARQKWESLGRMASGVAHDFNNLLGSALAQAELATAQLADGSSPREELQTIRDLAISGSEIVRELMIYAGKESAAVTLVDVSRIIEEMLPLLKVSVSKQTVLEVNLAKDLPAVRSNSARVRQIVMNLVTNASDAIGNRDGVIRVTTGFMKADRDSYGQISSHLAGDDYVRLEVSDNGCGMPPETQAKVLDPFFTTKATGHGLGLATVDGIVRSLRGEIHLASELGKGTTFQILLPCEGGAAEAVSVAPSSM
jgi:PAS domain S-box-containing protein